MIASLCECVLAGWVCRAGFGRQTSRNGRVGYSLSRWDALRAFPKVGRMLSDSGNLVNQGKRSSTDVDVLVFYLQGGIF